ncbi:MAG: SDR family NAD(P)-dependent oxidoreductase [Hyphomonas sp.]|nr:SDR family NAD(P)-dependent oxidoreductase [Hyphomonas sp.]MCB9962860.1 SDR family NAD(P)-dependent oxidoreductase [Hyphomonas sp.]MCB9972802.1 SDR family NAD(P)-dependent oxidoreductase [Hyphomonas sp.]
MFAGKVWWITGASSGIGEALAKALSARGANLILSGRNVPALEAVAAKCPAETMILPFEATDFDAIPALADKAWSWAEGHGGLDGLVNNAGISQRSLAVDTVFDVYRRIVDVDLLAPIALTQALLPRMAKAGHGHIIGISSVAGTAGVPLRSAYCAAKHGLIGYHDSVRAETAHLGLKVLVVAPGSVRTNVSRNALDAGAGVRGVSDAAIDNGMDPDDAAAAILEALEQDKRELILATGMELEIPRLRRHDPEALFDMMASLVAGGYAQRMDAES